MAAATVPGFVRDDRIGRVAGDLPEIVQALQVDGLRHPLLGQHAGTQHHRENLVNVRRWQRLQVVDVKIPVDYVTGT